MADYRDWNALFNGPLIQFFKVRVAKPLLKQ